jgi:hypothetical protein
MLGMAGPLALYGATPAKAARAAENLICDLAVGSNTDVLAECAGPAGGRPGDIFISLIGSPPNAVRAVALRWSGEAEPFQSIAIEAFPVIDLETVGILYLDMNFDGHRDLAVMRTLTGDDAGYQFYLFAPDSGRFETNLELERMAWPEFDQRRGAVITNWSDDSRRGRDFFTWTPAGRLVLEGRTEWLQPPGGPCTQKHYRAIDDTLTLTAEGACE